jgi:hypothetical protein
VSRIKQNTSMEVSSDLICYRNVVALPVWQCHYVPYRFNSIYKSMVWDFMTTLFQWVDSVWSCSGRKKNLNRRPKWLPVRPCHRHSPLFLWVSWLYAHRECPATRYG